MTAEDLHDWRSRVATEIEHLRAVLAQPNDYFSPKGAQHWFQVVSRSEVEDRLAGQMRLIEHINTQLAA